MDEEKYNQHVNYNISQQGGSLKVTLTAEFCKLNGIYRGQLIAVRDYGGRCLIIGSEKDVYGVKEWHLQPTAYGIYEHRKIIIINRS